MSAFALLCGGAAITTLLSAILLDSVQNSRGDTPAPKAFALLLMFFLTLQVAIFIIAALAADPSLRRMEATSFSRFLYFILEDLKLSFAAVLVWYLPRFLFVSLGLAYTKILRRVFLAVFILVGASKVLVINAQALAYWTDSGKPIVKKAFIIDDTIGLPLFYMAVAYLLIKAWRGLRRAGKARTISYFWGRGFLAILGSFLLADLFERFFGDPFLAGLFGLNASPVPPFPFVSLSGAGLGLYVSLKAASSLKRALAPEQDHAPLRCGSTLAGFGLTDREEKIALLLLKGFVNKEIAQHFDIGYGTVKNHVYSIFKKLGISSRFELVKLAERLRSTKAPPSPS